HLNHTSESGLGRKWGLPRKDCSIEWVCQPLQVSFLLAVRTSVEIQKTVTIISSVCSVLPNSVSNTYFPHHQFPHIMKILITGGAGFIGSALIRHIIDTTDDEVVNLDK